MSALFQKFRAIFAYAGLFSLFINILLLAPSLYMMQVFDRVLSSRSNDTLLMLTLLTVFGLLIMMLLEMLRSRLLVIAGLAIDRALGPRIIEGIIRQTATLRPEAQQASLRDVNVLRNFFAGTGIFTLFDAPWLPLYMLLIFAFSPTVGMFGMAGVVLMTGIGVLTDLFSRRSLEAMQEGSRNSGRFIEASMRNAEVIYGLGMQRNIVDHWKTHNEQVLNLHVKSSHTTGAMTAITKFARQFIQVIMMAVGVYLIVDEHLSPGVMLAATFIMSRAMMPVEQMIASWSMMVEARSAWNRLHGLMLEQQADAQEIVLPTPTGTVTLENISFGFNPQRPPILRGINLTMTAGDSIGIAGPSGSGKSTLARLVTGIWRPSFGTVRLDGADLATWPRDKLGLYMGYLPQDVELFNGTIAENIARMGAVDSEAVLAAAKLARVHDMILHLPNGYETVIGDNGIQLSGGQRQRIGLARAVYGQPKLIVLDEPNASLDSEGEASLFDVFTDLKAAGTTLVVIAHRPSLFQHFDKMMILRDGVVAAYGPRQDVLARFS